MTVFDEIPPRYHDRIHETLDGPATVIVEDGDYTVPHITNADRLAMGLPPGRHPDRVRTPEHWWFPPS